MITMNDEHGDDDNGGENDDTYIAMYDSCA